MVKHINQDKSSQKIIGHVVHTYGFFQATRWPENAKFFQQTAPEG